MRICLVSYGFPDFENGETNGIATYNYWSALGLARLGHQVLVLTPFGKPANGEPLAQSDRIRVWKYDIGNLHYYVHRTGLFKSAPLWIKQYEVYWAAIQAIKRLIQSENIDVIESSGPLLPWPLRSVVKGIPCVITLHGLPLVFKEQMGMSTSLIDRLGHCAIYQHGLALADAVVAPTKFVADQALRIGVALSKLQIIPPPISEEFECRHSGCVPEFSRDPNSPIVLTVSPLNKSKGLDVLSAAIPLVIKEFSQVRFVLVGKREDEDVAKVLTRFNNNNVILTGPIGWPSVSKIFSAADMYVSPTRFETVGYTILEAMICAMPVVASRVGGVIDLVDDGRTGLLVPPGDPKALAESILKMLRMRDRGKEMGNRGRMKLLDNFNLDVITRRKIELYASLCRKRK